MNADHYIILLVIAVRTSRFDADRQLKLVFAVWRHGDRSPVDLYPKIGKQNGEDSWKRGLGQLTAEGTRQAFELGKTLRERYETFLPEFYHYDTANFYSTDFDRTIMTAQCVTAGMYKPVQFWYSNDSQAKNSREYELGRIWQPIPVHVNPADNDPISGTSPCIIYTEYDPILIKTSPEYVKHGASLEFACAQTGLDCNLPDSIINIYDTIFIERQYNLRDKNVHGWPSWMNDTIFNSLSVLHNVAWRSLISTPERRSHIGGVLLNYILDTLQDKNQNASNMLMFYGASGHDYTVLSQLGLIREGDKGIVQPGYTSCIMYELYSDESIEIYYRNGTNGIEKLAVSGCPYPCRLREFIKVMSRRSLPKCTVPHMVENICSYAKVKPITVMFLSFLVGVAIIVTCFFIYRKAKLAQKKLENTVQYMQIANDGTILLSDDSEDDIHVREDRA